MILRLLFCILTLGAFSSPCLANLALRGKSFSPGCKKQVRKEVKFNHKAPKRAEASITHDDVATIIPTQFQENETSQHVVNRIFQNSANALLNAPIIKNSFLMKTAKKVEDTTKMDIAVKQKGNAINSETEHKFKFDMQALKGFANMKYSGYFDSKVEYRAENQTFLVSLEEKLSNNAKIALSHIKDRQESKQLLQYQLSW